MGNMSYCRFQNTSQDMGDCVSAVGEMLESGFDMSREEQRGFKELLEQSVSLLVLVADSIGMDLEKLVEKIEFESKAVVGEFAVACQDFDDEDVPE